jgi:hypothetical protein
MENIFEDEEIRKATEEYDRSVASSLLAIKNSKKESQKSSKSVKMTEWKEYVRDVHNEISDNGRIKISYSKAISEASRRKKMNTNLENLNKIRLDKIAKNRSKKEVGTQTEVGFKSGFLEIYSYKIKKNEDVLVESEFHFEDFNKCLSSGLVKILDLYMSEVPYEFFEIPGFRNYYDDSNEDLKIFINSLIYTYFDKIFDEPYREELDIVDERFMNNYARCSLESFWYITNSIFKNSKKFFTLNVVPKILVKKIN